MQDVNNDMDDLFRKAAEQYPLKTDDADWKKVLAGLQDTGTDAPMLAMDKKGKRKKRALWLLLLLPFVLLYTVWYNGAEPGNKQWGTNKKNTQKKVSDNRNNSSNNTLGEKPLVSEEQKINNAKTLKQKINDTAINKADDVIKNMDPNTSYSRGIKNDKLNKADRANLYINANKNNRSATSPFITGKTTTALSSDQNIGKNEIIYNSNKNSSTEKQLNESPDRILNTITGDNRKDIVAKQNEADSNSLHVNKSDSAVAKSVAEDNKKEAKIKVETRYQKGFYGGLSGSFDISTIKLQRINKTGYGLNILAGYRFSKRISVETGLGWNLKNYYSVGNYFDKAKTGIPAAVKIYFANGNCKMFEVPVNVKYDFVARKKSSLFATAGWSSYFMKKEDYSYHAILGTWIYDTTKYYTNSGASWFAVANVSIGYGLQVSKHSTLRIEPYIKIPLRGIGIANMPITSTGISVGFMRKF